MKIPHVSDEWRILFKPEKYGKYYITTCGWTDKPVPHKGCVSIAPLDRT